jgi:carbon monoxide dehydrogenase subunit G
MDMSGEYVIQAPRQKVWEALNDPEILRQCIPGCEEIDKHSDTEMSAKVTAKVGPVKAKFTGQVTLSELDPPNGYTISGEGKGGPAGFAKGGAKVKLSDADGGGTTLAYEVSATVGGKLAQIGARLIDSTAKKMANEFFGNFSDLVGSDVASDAPAPKAAPETGPKTGAPQPDATGDHSMRPSHVPDENTYDKANWAIYLSFGIAIVALVMFISYM